MKNHEIQWELENHKKKVIIKVCSEDFIEQVENYNTGMSNNYIFKNPATYKARVVGIKMKIFRATGIPPHKQDKNRVSVSNKNTPLAWVTFSNPKIVQDIFRLSVQTGNGKRFNAFPHIPGKVMARHKKIIEILKELQSINLNLCYQIRLGQNDLEVRIKSHFKFDWQPYVKTELIALDPNDTIPEWELTGDTSKLINTTLNDPTNKSKNKRLARTSPEGQVNKKK